MRKRLGILVVVLVSALAFAPAGWAPAPRGAVQYAGLVLKKLDEATPPSYTNEFFTNRVALTTAVADVVRLMADPEATIGWCEPIANIFNLATLTNAYFEIGQTLNPALDDFKKDWLKVQQLADCA